MQIKYLIILLLSVIVNPYFSNSQNNKVVASDSEFIKTIYRHLQYPNQAVDSSWQGFIFTFLTTDKNGTINTLLIMDNSVLGQELRRVLSKLMKSKIRLAHNNSQLVVPFVFKIENAPPVPLIESWDDIFEITGKKVYSRKCILFKPIVLNSFEGGSKN